MNAIAEEILSYYGHSDSLNSLEHHGVKGMKWGERNGPPYPLNEEGQLKKLNGFNSDLNKWDYGVLINGKVETDADKIDWSKYKTIPIKDVEKYHVGICWDFVNYQHSVFKKSGYQDESHLFVMQRSDDPNDIVTHTFSTVNIGDKKYWFESSWFKHQGVHEVTSYKDVIDTLVEEYGPGKGFDVYKYNPDGMDNGLTNGEFFNKATQNLVYTTEEVKHSSNAIAEEILSYYGTAEEAKDSLEHYGMPRRSGRYPWGSGEDPYQHNQDFLSRVEALKKQGWTETAENVKKAFGENVTLEDYRNEKSWCNYERRLLQVNRAKSLAADGKGATEIGREMGIPESTVRSLLNPKSEERMKVAAETADFLKKQVAEKGMIDVGAGVEYELGVTRTRLDQALYKLKGEGYEVYGNRFDQVTNANQKTTQQVLCPPGTEHKEIYNLENIHTIKDYRAIDGGEGFRKKFTYPESLDSKRLMIRYKEDGGESMDGLVELRPGKEDLSLGESRYAQVRIMVDGKKYIKGMAVYGNPKDFPDGVDVIFNTNKTKDKSKMEVLKDIKDDPENPFGSLIKDADQGGQYWYKGKDGKDHLGLINKRADQGDWDEWKDTLPSQFLGKQSLPMAKKQLDLAKADKQAEFEEICSLNNPTVKKYWLNKFADGCDSAAVHLKAAALP